MGVSVDTSNQQQGPCYPCELAKLALNRARLGRAKAAVMALGEGDPETEFLLMVLHLARFRAPFAKDLAELVNTLPGMGWKVIPPHFSAPASGWLFVQAKGDGEIQRVGLVGALHKSGVGTDAITHRDYFSVATDQPGRGERVEIPSVSFFLAPPSA